MLAILRHNWQLKLGAAAIAFALWLFVGSRDRSHLSVAAAVEYVGLESNRVLVGKPQDIVDVQLEAPRWAMPRLTPGNVRVRVDLARVREGESVVPLSPAHVEAPPGVAVTGLSPAWVRVAVTSALVKPVKVVPQVQGSPAAGHVVTRVVADPPTVEVKGPRPNLERRSAISTAPIDVSGSRESVTQRVGLLLPESVYAIRDRTVEVTVDIRSEESAPPSSRRPRP
jgi:YbbR domain-containing protein